MDVLTSGGDDDIFGSSNEPEPPSPIQPAQITSAEPPILREDRAGCLTVSKVASHHVRAAGLYLAYAFVVSGFDS
jgi:hypothetical protein